MHSKIKIAGVASLLTIFGLGTANAADPLVPPAPAPNANTIQLKISGQVNRAILWGDNGDNDEVFYTDNDNTGTRFRFVASGRLNDDVTAGATIELQFESNSSTDIRFGANGGTGGTASGTTPVGERIAEVWLNSASMGKLSLGQGNTASNGTAETDLSGTGIASYSLAGGGQDGLQFQNGGVVGSTVSANFTNLDGGSRRDRIRYDTPTFAGFRLSTSASQGGRNDVALRYANQFAGARIAASIGY
ncbi:MAG: porin, partial [Roseicyclus sp.]|nr:porin [Roseicyclus sp.]